MITISPISSANAYIYSYSFKYGIKGNVKTHAENTKIDHLKDYGFGDLSTSPTILTNRNREDGLGMIIDIKI